MSFVYPGCRYISAVNRYMALPCDQSNTAFESAILIYSHLNVWHCFSWLEYIFTKKSPNKLLVLISGTYLYVWRRVKKTSWLVSKQTNHSRGKMFRYPMVSCQAFVPVANFGVV